MPFYGKKMAKFHYFHKKSPYLPNYRNKIINLDIILKIMNRALRFWISVKNSAHSDLKIYIFLTSGDVNFDPNFGLFGYNSISNIFYRFSQ